MPVTFFKRSHHALCASSFRHVGALDRIMQLEDDLPPPVGAAETWTALPVPVP